MFKKLMIILLSFSFVLSVYGQSSDTHIDDDHHETPCAEVEQVSSTDQVEHSDCEDCHSNGCEDESCCHLSLCCVTPFFEKSGSHYTAVNSYSNSKMEWYISNHYRPPYLDASLKPPLFS